MNSIEKELSPFFTSILPELAPNALRSFGPGGQVYTAEIWGGFNIVPETENPVFDKKRSDTSYPNAKIYTNLHEGGKIGSTMEFLVTHVGIRLFSLSPSAAITQAQLSALKKSLASAKIEIGVGTDNTKVGEFTGLHFMSTVDGVAAATFSLEPYNMGSNFIPLSIPIPFQRNVELRGNVQFAEAPDAAICPDTTGENAGKPKFGFAVILHGYKVVAA